MIPSYDFHGFAGTLLDVALRQSAVVAVAAMAALLLRRRSAALRHAVWAAAVLAALAIATLATTPRWVLPILPATAPAASSPASTVVARPTADAPEHAPPPTRRIPLDAIVAGLWALGALVMAARLARSHALLGRIVRGAVAIENGDARAEHDAAARSLGMRRPVALRATEEITVPLAYGLRRPVVLVPAGVVARSRRAVLAHELAHHRRGDVAWALVGEIARVLCWFQPLVHFAVRRMRAASEFACDDAAIAAGEPPSSLADALVALAPRIATVEPAAIGMAGRSSVVARVEALLGRRDRRAVGRAGGLAVAALTLAVTVLAGVGTPGTATSSSRALHEATVKDRPGAPVRILGAVVEARWSEHGASEIVFTRPMLGLASRDGRRTIQAVLLDIRSWTSHDRLWATVEVPPREGGHLRLPESRWSNAVPRDRTGITLSIAAVRFTDGTTWPDRIEPENNAAVPPVPSRTPESRATPRSAPAPPTVRPALPDRGAPTPAPTPPVLDESEAPGAEVPTPPPPVRAEENRFAAPFMPPPGTVMLPVRVRNFAGAPARIVEAHTRRLGGAGADEDIAAIPAITVRNDARRTIVAVRVRYKATADEHGVSGFRVLVRPGRTAVLGDMARLMTGRPETMTVQLLGVRFDDGSVWGSMDSRIDTREEWIDPEATSE